jgi:hypothetical protein
MFGVEGHDCPLRLRAALLRRDQWRKRAVKSIAENPTTGIVAAIVGWGSMAPGRSRLAIHLLQPDLRFARPPRDQATRVIAFHRPGALNRHHNCLEINDAENNCRL